MNPPPRILPGVLYRQDPGEHEIPLVFDSPHSGTDYPGDFQYSCPYDVLRAAEDTFVDELYAAAPVHGATLIGAYFPRSYIDVNRDVGDIDQHLLDAPWPRKLAPGDKNEWASEFYSASLAKEKLHPITGHPAESCTEQQGIPGPWYERLPHFKMNFTPSSGRELQTEYFVPRDRGYEAILAVEKLRDQITPHLFVTELRTIASDDLWMSMAYQRPSLSIHFTWKPEWPEVRQILPQIEAQLAPFGARPHWAKLFTVPPARIQAQYTRLADFKAALQRIDPTGKFRNAFLNTNLYSS